jgi:hypothetical protein
MEKLGSQCMPFRKILRCRPLLKSAERIQVYLKREKIYGILHEDLTTFIATSCLILHIMKNVSPKLLRKSKRIFRVKNAVPEYRAFHKTITKITAQPDRPQIMLTEHGAKKM